VTAHDGFTLRDLVSYGEEAQRGERRENGANRTIARGTAAPKVAATIPP
jgi:pullulanase/glycogen debranching enzyme